MTRLDSNSNFADCLTVGGAAKFLGVSTATLRNWDRAGKLKSRRHPHNGYRIYLHEDLKMVLRSAELSNYGEEPRTPQVDWSEMRDSEHFVQFYESDEYLVDSIGGFVSAALVDEQSSVVIATPDHRNALQRRLVALGINVADAIESGRYVVLDAADTLSKFMVDGSPDVRRFNKVIGTLIGQLTEGGRQRVHAFGEMVALLWSDGNRHAAIRLEELWNDLAKTHKFALFCAYPINGFSGELDGESLNGVCGCHSRVIPAESHSAIDSADRRLREITLLQQKAHSLTAEIEHRGEVEKILSKRERELADFFENATEGLHKVGADGTILWANRADYELLGFVADEYIGRSITEFHADADVIAEILRRLKAGETLKNFPARLRCKNGTIKHVLISSNACFDDGKFSYTRCFTRDVSQQWQAEQALIEADRRKDAFLATLAHELRNPLAPIRNSLEALRLASREEEIAEEARHVIERQVGQLTRLVDDLLDVSRIARDKIDLRMQRVELAAVIRSAIETSRPAIDSAGHKLSVVLPSQPVFLDADPMRMAQIFSNLLNNAAKYTEPGGRIEVHAELAGRDVVVRVVDNGIGISCETLAYVFDMFRQADHSLERAQGGLGIGLTLVRRLVELHGGAINAQSEGPGRGSAFLVRLPVASAIKRNRQPREAGPIAAPVVPSKQRVLVVDDNQDSGNTLSTLLRIKGHEVCTAHDGLQAIDAVARFQPTVILMDVGMPKLNGYEATRRIRQMPGGERICIVALTGWGQADDVERSKEAGCSAHLVKPVEFSVLGQLLAISATSKD